MKRMSGGAAPAVHLESRALALVTSAGIILVTQKDLVHLPRPDALDCATDVLVSRVYETVQENVA